MMNGYINMRSGNKIMQVLSYALVVVALSILQIHTSAAQEAGGLNTLKTVDYVSLPGGKVQLKLSFEKPVSSVPKSFSIDRPPRLSVDFAGTSLALENKTMQFDSGVVGGLRAVESNGRTRLVVSLKTMVPYEFRTDANDVFINFENQRQQVQVVQAEGVTGFVKSSLPAIDFRRGENGEGKISIALSDAATVVNMEERGTKIVVDFVNSSLPEKLVRRLDVTDFATPISTIDAFNVSHGARIIIDSNGDYEHMAYQAGNEFNIDVRPLSEGEMIEKKKDRYGYSGEKLSLNFQNIEVRAVLQLLADFTDKNVVASDTVQGNITLRLKNVPWDQALDIILRTRGLGMRESGNVILIAPNAEIAAREKEELEAQKQRVDLSPVTTRYHQINYANASDIAAMLKGEKNSILTERGSVTIDSRTNTLMILESAEKHEEIAALIAKLDVPVKQVMIESRVVIASDDFGRDIGVRTGVSHVDQYDLVGGSPDTVAITGSQAAASASAFSGALPTTASDRYNVNLPGSGTGRIGMAILGSTFLVDLELSALQTEGRGEVLSNPRVITSNQQTAKISQGVDVPYQEASSSGATSISFKKADLSMEVTPLITPDDRIDMKLKITKNSIGGIYAGVPSIDTREVDTQVLVNNGETVVLGGIYEESKSKGSSKVPFFGDLPLVGALFRSSSKKESKAELLVFVTPKILDDALTVAQ